MRDLGTEALVGRKILNASINEHKDLVVLETDKGILYLTWEGDCCATCYIEHLSGSEALVDSTILEVYHSKWKSIKDDEDDVIESMGTNIKTTKGYVTFETRLEHNGYYSGTILVSDKAPLDQYLDRRYNNKMPKLKPLEDF